MSCLLTLLTGFTKLDYQFSLTKTFGRGPNSYIFYERDPIKVPLVDVLLVAEVGISRVVSRMPNVTECVCSQMGSHHLLTSGEFKMMPRLESNLGMGWNFITRKGPRRR